MSSIVNRLFTEPLVYWTSAASRLKQHADKSDFHKNCVPTMSEFVKVMEHKSVPIRQLMTSAINERIKENRAKLVLIFQTIMSCGRQNLALRGHRDDFTNFDTSDNPRNFQTLLDLRIEGGNKVLQDHFKNAPRNAIYRSKTIQNETIDCCGHHIRQIIINEVKETTYFSVLADEAQDVSSKEQMPLVLRFVDKNGNIREKIIKFIICDEGVSGAAISKSITIEIRSLGLDMQNCRGQGYDEAGNMAGKYQGTAARIQREYPLTLYVHCGSHRSNLCNVKSCEILLVKTMMDKVKLVADFLATHLKGSKL